MRFQASSLCDILQRFFLVAMENPCYFYEFWCSLQFLLSLLFLMYLPFLLYISASSFLKTFFVKTATQICWPIFATACNPCEICCSCYIFYFFHTFLKTCVFDARKRRTGVDGGLKRRKNLRFSKYPDTCTRPHVKTLKIGHFHGLVVWRRQRDEQQIMMHAQAYCIFVFLLAVAVVGS